MNHPYLNCRIRVNEDLCNLKAEFCKSIHRRNVYEEQIREIESRFGEMQEEDIKRVYRDNGGI